MMKKNIRQKKVGFGLVEVLVVLGLMGGMFLILSQFMGQSFKGQKKITANLEFDTRMWELLSALRSTTYCNSSQNQIFKELQSGGTLISAKLSSENNPTTNTLNWLGYQVGAQDIKIIAEGDSIGGALTVSDISLERQKDVNGNIISAQANSPSVGKTMHLMNLIITATPSSGSGFPQVKTFKMTMITDDGTSGSSNSVVGCYTSPESTPSIDTPSRKFPTNFTCNDINVSGTKWSIGFWFHAVEYRANKTIRSIRYRDLYNRTIDFNADGTYQDSSGGVGSCVNKSIDALTSAVTTPL